MVDTRTKKQEEYSRDQDIEKILRQAIEFDLYESASRFVKNEMGKKGYRISLQRHFTVGYPKLGPRRETWSPTTGSFFNSTIHSFCSDYTSICCG
jgi:hypothetical protein